MNGVFDPMDQGWRLARRRVRSDIVPVWGRLRTWLKAGMLEPDGWVSHPDTGTPQGGVRLAGVSPRRIDMRRGTGGLTRWSSPMGGERR